MKTSIINGSNALLDTTYNVIKKEGSNNTIFLDQVDNTIENVGALDIIFQLMKSILLNQFLIPIRGQQFNLSYYG